MEDTEESVKATATTRSLEFSATKPLPPIGTSTARDEEGSHNSGVDDDAKSVESTGASARPRIVQGFRPESISDDEMDDEKRTHRSVSFNDRTPMAQKRKTYDGREITMVTLDTQTDWDWVERKEMADTAVSGSDKTSTPEAKEKLSQSPKSGMSRYESQDGKGTPDVPPYMMPYNDEYGIPILDLSSDTDDRQFRSKPITEKSSDEEVSHKKVKDDRTFMPSIGPPNILQHSNGLRSIQDCTNMSPEERIQARRFSSVRRKSIILTAYQRESEKHEIPVDDPESRMPEDDYDRDDTGVAHGMFSGNCEFCKQPIKPFPSLEQQQQLAPETLYCCNDYREFVEYVLSTTRDMEEEQNKKNKMIDIKPHEHVGSKQERNAAKEKAVQRMRERELQRRQQEASGLQQNFFASGIAGMGIAGMSKAGGFVKMGGTNVSMKDMFVARQMKTINYQLSSQKCLEEGWTVRAPSPLFDDDGDDVFTPEPLNPAMIEDGKTMADTYASYSEVSSARDVFLINLRDRPLIEKYYESGQKFLTMFPDGTGNVFYPSGNLAILISSVKLGQYHYTIHHDFQRSGVAAAFEPNGYGYCYFPNGDIRLYIDQYGGIELDNIGGRRRKWSWKDQVIHVHAPPFQPICIGLNKNIGVRVMSQENIALTYSANKRSCRFNMGSRLKRKYPEPLVAPENAPLKEVEEEYIFLEEKKTQVDALLNKVANLLKFPNNPKLDKMLPPLHVTSKQNKTEKLKKDRQVYLAQQSARDKKQPSISVS